MPAENRPASPKSPESAPKDATPVSIPIVSARERLDALKELGRYKIERKLGQGGMGTVFLARDTELKRLAAIKILPEDKAQNPILVKRFRAEAQAAAQLRHDNIVTVYDSGEQDGLLYIAMEYVDGPDVFDLIQKRGRIAPRRSLDIIRQTTLALQHAYEKNIVHRDIKPSNLMIRRDGVVKITDLGLARSIDETLETNITRAGTTVGTVDYMSPEQARNSKLADIRSDIYSLGCTWYHMLTGTAPYAEGSVTNKLHAHAVKPIPDPRDINPEVPEGFVAVLQRMMAKKPADRYQTPAELLKDLDAPSLKRVSAADEIAREVARELESDEALTPARENVSSSGRQKLATAGGQSSSGGYSRPVEHRESRNADGREEGHKPSTLPPRRAPAGGEPSAPISFDFRKLVIPLVAIAGVGALIWFGKTLADFGNVFGLGSTPVPAPVQGSFFENNGSETEVTTPTQATPAEAAAGANQSATGTNPSTGQNSAQAQQAGASNNMSPATTAPPIVPEQARIAEVPKPSLTELPRWTLEPFSQTGLPVITVSTSATGPGTAKTITEAIKRIPPAGAILKLSSKERHDLPAGLSIRTERLLITGDQGFATIHLLPESDASSETAGKKSTTGEAAPGNGVKPLVSGLTIISKQVQLEKLHWLAEADVSTSLNALVRVESPRLTVRESSMTALLRSNANQERAPESMLTAVDWQNTANGATFDRGGQLLIDTLFTRGAQLGAVSISGGASQSVLRQSLFLGGAVPLVRMNPAGSNGSPNVGANGSEVRRALLLQHVTALTSDSIVEITPPADGQPVDGLWVGLSESVFAAMSTGKKSSSLIRAAGWPQNPNRQADESRLVDFSIASERNLCCGLTRLYDSGESTGLQVTDPLTWRRFFATDFDGQARPDLWPGNALPVNPAEIEKWSPALVDTSAIPDAPLSKISAILGCDVTLLSTPALTDQSWSKVSTPLLKLRQQLDPANPKETTTLDLATYGNDLGQLLSRSDIPQNGHLEITGFGIRTMTPVILKNRRLILTFNSPPDKAPLVIQPKPAGDKKGLFEVEGGSLEIRHAVLRGVGGGKPAPENFFVSRGGTIICRHVKIEGGMTEDWQPKDVFHLTGSGKGELNLGFVESVAQSPGRFAALQGVQSSALLLQSGIVSGVANFHVEPGLSSGTDWHQIDLRHATLLAGEGVFRLFGTAEDFRYPPVIAPDDQRKSKPQGSVRIVTDTSILGKLSGFGRSGQPAALIEVPELADLTRWAEWHSRETAIGPLPDLLIRSARRQIPLESTAWQKAWTNPSNTNLIMSPGFVTFAKNWPSQPREWKELLASQFQLSAAAKAAKAGEGELPLGVTMEALEEIGPLKKGKPATSNTEKSNTKTNPGF